MKRAWALLPLLVLPLPSSAQTLTGRVLESGTGGPVVGAMVRLMSGNAWTGVLHLTPADGSYRLQAPGAGEFSVRVERIGFAETVAGPFALQAGETLRQDLVVATAPVRLEGLEVSGARRRCDLGKGGGDATQLLWAEARKALAAASWTQREGSLSFRVAVRQRQLDPKTTAVLDESHQVRTVMGGNSVQSLPPEKLAEDGYVQESDGRRYFYGPDVEALLSDVFLTTHCFEAAEPDDDEPQLMGLRFEPVGGRRVPDVEGTLWMDRASNRLERIDFRYTGLDLGPGDRLATGQVRYAELADGRWIVRDWYVRAPLMTELRNPSDRHGQVNRTLVHSVSEVGSEVLSVSGEGFEWSSSEESGRVVGTVYDSIAGAPLAGAEVRLAGRGWRARADAEGHFEIRDVPAGRYRITLTHPRIDSLGVMPWSREVDVPAGEAGRVALAIPSSLSLLAWRCPQERGAALVGRVLDALDGLPLRGAVVTVVSGLDEDGEAPTGVSDEEGRFWICGLPTDRTLGVEAHLGDRVAPRLDVTTLADGFATLVLSVPLADPGGLRTPG